MMSKNKEIIVGTRGSLLALTQAEQTCKIIFNDGCNYSLKKILTTGDLEQKKTFSEFGRQALFSKELDDALLSGECDLAIHSFKDLTGSVPQGLRIHMLCNQVDASDCFVSEKFKKIEDMPKNSIIGTSSVRRYAILKKYFPDLVIKPIRGNIDTRIKKMQQGDYDGVLLAKAGLIRLEKENLVSSTLDKALFTPALGQGLIAVVTREDHDLSSMLNMNSNVSFYQAILRLKKMMSEYEGGCSLPFGLDINSINDNLKINTYLGNAIDNTELRFSIELDANDVNELEKVFKQKMKLHDAQKVCDAMKNFKIPYATN